MKIAISLAIINCDGLKLKGSTYTSRCHALILSRRSVIAFSLHYNKKSFSSAMDQVFLFAFNGMLIVFERRKK